MKCYEEVWIATPNAVTGPGFWTLVEIPCPWDTPWNAKADTTTTLTPEKPGEDIRSELDKVKESNRKLLDEHSGPDIVIPPWVLADEEKKRQRRLEAEENRNKGPIKKGTSGGNPAGDSSEEGKPFTKCKCTRSDSQNGRGIQLTRDDGSSIKLNEFIYSTTLGKYIPNPDLVLYGIKFNDNPKPGESCCSTASGRIPKLPRGGILGMFTIAGNILSSGPVKKSEDPVNPYDVDIDCDEEMRKLIIQGLKEVQDKLKKWKLYVARFQGCSDKLDKLLNCIKGKANSLGTTKYIKCDDTGRFAGLTSSDNKTIQIDSSLANEGQDVITGTLFHEIMHTCDDGSVFSDEVLEQDAKFMTMAFFGDGTYFGLDKGTFLKMIGDHAKFNPNQPWQGVIESSFFVWDTKTGKIWCKDSAGNKGKEIDVLGDGEPLLPEPGWI